jgi:hypothetical protein
MPRIVGAFATFSFLVGVAVLPQLASAQYTPTSIVKERHAELRSALRALERACDDLQKGAHDYGGERVEALKDTNKASAEVRQAISKDQH